MARLPRFCPKGYPQHIIQRGNNRQACFFTDDDYASYACWLKEYALEFGVDIHAWVFMSNHVHLLVTPQSDESISMMMQALGRRYVRYFNRAHSRTGTLWEGRFKSCLIQAEQYLLNVYKYIELNPVRANMVADPADYHWSSYHCNALGVASSFCVPHEVYMRLGTTEIERKAAYLALFKRRQSHAVIKNIRETIQKDLALGNACFKRKLERIYGRRVTPNKCGRPKSVKRGV